MEEAPGPEIVLVPPKGLDEFGFESGLPIVVDWKSTAWTAPELLDWYRRYQDVSTLYEGKFDCGRVRTIAANYGVTWVVRPVDRIYGQVLAKCPTEASVYDDDSYVVLRVFDEGPVPAMSKTKTPIRDEREMSR